MGGRRVAACGGWGIGVNGPERVTPLPYPAESRNPGSGSCLGVDTRGTSSTMPDAERVLALELQLPPPGEASLRVEIPEGETVLALKQRAATAAGVPAAQLWLFARGRQLRDHVMLRDCSLRPEGERITVQAFESELTVCPTPGCNCQLQAHKLARHLKRCPVRAERRALLDLGFCRPGVNSGGAPASSCIGGVSGDVGAERAEASAGPARHVASCRDDRRARGAARPPLSAQPPSDELLERVRRAHAAALPELVHAAGPGRDAGGIAPAAVVSAAEAARHHGPMTVEDQLRPQARHRQQRLALAEHLAATGACPAPPPARLPTTHPSAPHPRPWRDDDTLDGFPFLTRGGACSPGGHTRADD